MSRSIRRVAIVLPSGPPAPAALAAGVAWLQAAGVVVVPPRPRSAAAVDASDVPAFLAGDDACRAAELTDALAAADVDAVWAGRGGVGAFRTLSALDCHAPAAFAARPALPLLGLSDATALLLARHQAGAAAVHAPVVTMLAGQDRASAAAMRAYLRDPGAGRRLRALARAPRTGSAAEGPIVAGNLALLAACCGLPEQPRLAGALLLIEDVGEPAWRVDRFFAQLERAGALRGLRGLGVGDFGPAAIGSAATAVACAWAARLGVPVLAGLPLGHRRRNAPLPLGRWGRLDPAAGCLELAAQEAQ